MTKPWMLDELAHAGPEHLDLDFVAGYERKQGYPDPAEDLAVLAAHGLNETSIVVDLGAGTGRFALAAARRFGQVTAVDISPAMLEYLRDRAATAAVTNLACVQAGFLSYQHAGPPADAVYTRNALHQLPDFWKAVALDRIGTMLRPGGVLRLHDLIYDFQPSEADTVFQRWLENAAEDPARDTPARTSPSTSAPSTAPSAGCWNRCLLPPASRSSPRTLAVRCTAPTPAASAEPQATTCSYSSRGG